MGQDGGRRGWGIAQRKAMTTWFLLSTLFVIHLFCWQATRSLRPPSSIHHRIRRSASEYNDSEPFDTSIPSYIQYLDLYESLSSNVRPVGFIALVLWLCFLFASVSIVASDFFCPNLSTIAARLGLSESVAGVTFLGLGNGSPDVFSTFAAMRANTGALAIGELIGAASFIVSVIAGSMTLIRPFRVPRYSFLRDVGFFTLATALMLIILWDGKIEGWEAAGMVVLYACYVAVVAGGSWWVERKRRQREILHKVRSEYAEEGQEPEYHDDPDFPNQPTSPSLEAHRPPLLSRHSASSLASILASPNLGPSSIADEAALQSLAERESHHHHHGPVRLGRRRTTTVRAGSPGLGGSDASSGMRRGATAIRPSLLDAIEFRDVVLSLSTSTQSHRSLPCTVESSARPRSSSYSHPMQLAPTPTDHHSDSQTITGPEYRRGRHTRGTNSAVLPRGKPPWDWEVPPTREERWGLSRESASSGAGEGRLIEFSPLPDGVEDPWRNATPRVPRTRLVPSGHSESGSVEPDSEEEGVRGRMIPGIMVTPAGGEGDLVSPARPAPPLASRPNRSNLFFRPSKRRAWRVFTTSLGVLFPSLQDLRAKSWVGRVAAVISCPPILVFNLTLPVVDEGSDCESERMEKIATEGSDNGGTESGDEDETASMMSARRRERDRQIAAALHSPAEHLHHDRSDSASPNGNANHFSFPTLPVDGQREDQDISTLALLPSASERMLEPWDGPTGAEITRVLSAVQCFLAPPFCVLALHGDQLEVWYIPAAVGIGLIFCGLSYTFLKDPQQKARLVLCFVGFFVAMVWILTIVNEVVGVLQCLGHVLGLSDAILGLTIFAMGNSLGDLVANVTIARMGFPIMAMSACFGGPMLNVLLGVGVSSSYMVASTGYPYQIDYSPTLIVSTMGLLLVLVATLVIVPLNGFLMSRKWGSFLILAYGAVLAVNVIVEVRTTKLPRH